MTWTLLLPAGAIALALGALTLGLHQVESELIRLRASLRRSGATAVAAHDLQRSAVRVRERGAKMQLDAKRRVVHPWRSRSRRHDR